MSKEKKFQKKPSLPLKKSFALLFTIYPLWQTTITILLGSSTRFFAVYGANFKIISLGPKRYIKKRLKYSISTVKREAF